MLPAKAAMHGRAAVVGPSSTLGWLAVVLCAVLTAVAPIAGWSLWGQPSLVATPAVTLILVLAGWHSDLAPRLAWNADGVTVRCGWRVATARWANVSAVWLAPSTISGERIVLQSGDQRFEGSLDRWWWLTRLSSRYATRNRRLLDQIQLVRGLADRVSGDGRPPSLHRFAPFVCALACWFGGFLAALMLA